MKRIFPSLLGFAAGFSLIVFLLLSSVDMSCFRLSFFDEQYRELNTAENLDMSHEDLMNATQTLLDYLRGSRDNIDVEVTVAGVSQPAFNARESAHMVDVRSLYQNAMIVRWSMLVLLLFSTACMFTDLCWDVLWNCRTSSDLNGNSDLLSVQYPSADNEPAGIRISTWEGLQSDRSKSDRQ